MGKFGSADDRDMAGSFYAIAQLGPKSTMTVWVDFNGRFHFWVAINAWELTATALVMICCSDQPPPSALIN
jgi:hypothetical protein